MPHVTFIHGIKNMPPKETLLKNWERFLSQGDGLSLATEGVTTSMIYWADIMYPEPKPVGAGYESVDSNLDEIEMAEDFDWIDELPDDEKAFVASMQESIASESLSDSQNLDEQIVSEGNDKELEKLSDLLPSAVKQFLIKCFARDTFYYLFNKKSPVPGNDFNVRDKIRELFVNQLAEDSSRNEDGVHIVIGHSMGTVISYDCLKNVPECPQVDAYITLGSPLGFREMYQNFKPAIRNEKAFPAEKLKGSWYNIFDEGDPIVAGVPLKQEFLDNGNVAVVEKQVVNPGFGFARHDINLYLSQNTLRQQIVELLDL